MAKNWMDPAVITESSKVFAAFSLVLTGVACWDVLSTLWFEWQIITGKRKWKWPMAIYIIARISMLLHIFAITINRNALHEVPCTQLTFMSKFCDALGTVASTLILALRTRAVWHQDIKVTILMGALLLGQIAVWSQTFRYSKAAWNPQRRLCDVISTAPRGMMIMVWGYTMAFDFVILLFCTYGLDSYRTSTFGHLLLRDGIVYFCVAFAANLIQTVMAGLHMNPVMNIITLSFALVVSVIAATTVFRNVFIAYDNFTSDPNDSSGSSVPTLRTGTHILFNRNTSGQEMSKNEIPLGDYKSTQDIEANPVHKVADVEVDDVPTQTQYIGRDFDNGDYNFSTEKAHAL